MSKSAIEIKTERQSEAVEAWLDSGAVSGCCAGTIAGVTGYGKTKVAIDVMMYFHKQGKLEEWLLQYNQKPIILVVPTEELRDTTWPDEIAKFHGVEGTRLFKKYVQAVCYASLNTVAGNGLLLIMDEVHNATANNTKEFSRTFFSNHIIGLSATPPDPRRDQSKADIIEKYAPVVYTYTYADALADGIISGFKVTVIGVPMDIYDKYIKGGSEKKGYFMTTESAAYNYANNQFKKAYAMPPGAAKSNFIQFVTNKRMHLIYSLKSKVKAAGMLLSKFHVPNKEMRTLVFDQSIERLESLIPPEFTFHSKKKYKKGEISAVHKFMSMENRILGAVNALNEGVNLPHIDIEIVMGCNSNARHTVQRIGRSIRYEEGHTVRIFMLESLGTQDSAWVNEALSEIPPELVERKTLAQVMAE
jgi:superfamily II DNA or RNA helicase